MILIISLCTILPLIVLVAGICSWRAGGSFCSTFELLIKAKRKVTQDNTQFKREFPVKVSDKGGEGGYPESQKLELNSVEWVQPDYQRNVSSSGEAVQVRKKRQI